MGSDPLIEGQDYTIDPDGRWVFTARYLLSRGYCCRNGCRNCPYGFVRPVDGQQQPASTGETPLVHEGE